MRTRLLHPRFFRCKALVVLERAHGGLPLRLVYSGLWCAADRAGRFRWEPDVLQLDILPWDAVDFGACLEALVAGGFVVRYGPGGAYGVIPTFALHQTVHPREAQSKLPPAGGGDAEAGERLAQGEPKASLGAAVPLNSGKSPPASTSASTSVSVTASGSVSFTDRHHGKDGKDGKDGVLENLKGEGLAAYRQALMFAPNPGAVTAEVLAIMAGMRPTIHRAAWSDVGLALHDLMGKGAVAAPSTIRSFVARTLRDRNPAHHPTTGQIAAPEAPL